MDRKAITLPPGQEEFIRRVYEANPRTVVVLITSFPVALPWAAGNASTILHVTHNSQELGNALGDVLFGEADPGGRLVQTWPRSLEQLPPMMDYDIRRGRTYMYFRGEPQYPFGYGLSYRPSRGAPPHQRRVDGARREPSTCRWTSGTRGHARDEVAAVRALSRLERSSARSSSCGASRGPRFARGDADRDASPARLGPGVGIPRATHGSSSRAGGS